MLSVTPNPFADHEQFTRIGHTNPLPPPGRHELLPQSQNLPGKGGTIDDAHHVTGSKSSTRLSTAVALVAWIREPRQLTDDLSNQKGATEWIHVFQPNTRSLANEGALRCCCQPICAQFAYLCTIYAHLALPELRAGAETRQVQPPLTAG